MAMRKPQRTEREDDSEDWLVTYADAITLLLAFFVLTTAISRIELPTFEEAQGAIAAELGKRDVVKPINKLETAVDQVLSDLAISSYSSVGKDAAGVVVEIDSSVLFNPGDARLRRDVDSQLEEIVRAIMSEQFSAYIVEIQSHAAQGSNHGAFPGLWDMTAARSVMLARYIIYRSNELGAAIVPERIKAVAYGDSRVRGNEDWKISKGLNQEAEEEREPANISNERTVFRIHPRIDAKGRRLRTNN